MNSSPDDHWCSWYNHLRATRMTPEQRDQAKLAINDEDTFGFLELAEKHSERQRKRALIAWVEDFLRATGGLFAFIGNQQKGF